MAFTREDPHYFGAGPALLPSEVVVQAAADFVNFKNIGLGLGEISHRSSDAIAVVNETKANLCKVLEIPDTHEVLFLQGGGSGGFSAIAYNMLAAFATKTGKKGKADYFVTGDWSSKASKEAERLGVEVNIVANTKDANGKYRSIPDKSTWKFGPASETAYVYYCDNETVAGVEFPSIPEVPKGVELVTDMSSNIMSRKIDVSKFGLIFGGAQKNIGIAGVSFYVIRKTLLERIPDAQLVALGIPLAPIVFDFPTIAKNNSSYNTLPIFAVHVMNLCVKTVMTKGGLEVQQAESERKSKVIYDVLDKNANIFNLPVEKTARSNMNIVFKINGEGLEEKFLKDAGKQGMTGLKGHRSVGGIRISNCECTEGLCFSGTNNLDNAVTEKSVDLLVKFINEFVADVKH